MGIADVRDAFNRVSQPKGVNCIAARLNWCDADGTPDGARTYQQLFFDVIQGDQRSTVQSDPLPPYTHVNQAAAALATQLYGNLPDVTP
jgi:hypothetical protein